MKNLFMSKVDSSEIDRQKYHEDLVKYADKAFEKDDFLDIYYEDNDWLIDQKALDNQWKLQTKNEFNAWK